MTTGVDTRAVEPEHHEPDPAYEAQLAASDGGRRAGEQARAYTGSVAFVDQQPVPAELPGAQEPPPSVRAAPRQSLDKGELLYMQGDAAAAAYLVESGLLALSIAARPGRERIVGLAGPGDIIGAHSEGLVRYLDTAAALSQEVNVVRLDLGGQAISQFGADVRYLLGVAAVQHLERLTNQLEDAEAPVPARVALTFLRLAERFGQATAEGATRLTLPLTHDTIASMVGAARETTSTTIEQLRKLGLVTGTRGRYVVRGDGLRAFAELAANA